VSDAPTGDHKRNKVVYSPKGRSVYVALFQSRATARSTPARELPDVRKALALEGIPPGAYITPQQLVRLPQQLPRMFKKTMGKLALTTEYLDCLGRRFGVTRNTPLSELITASRASPQARHRRTSARRSGLSWITNNEPDTSLDVKSTADATLLRMGFIATRAIQDLGLNLDPLASISLARAYTSIMADRLNAVSSTANEANLAELRNNAPYECESTLPCTNTTSALKLMCPQCEALHLQDQVRAYLCSNPEAADLLAQAFRRVSHRDERVASGFITRPTMDKWAYRSKTTLLTVQSFLRSIGTPMFQGAKRLNTEGGVIPQWLIEAHPTRWAGSRITNDSDSTDGPTQPEGVT